jgi:hypothetical protein
MLIADYIIPELFTLVGPAAESDIQTSVLTQLATIELKFDSHILCSQLPSQSFNSFSS